MAWSQLYPMPLGTYVHPYGKVGAVAFLGGERYYFLSEGNGVSMIPAFMLEPMARDPKAEQVAIDAGQVDESCGMTRYDHSWQQGLMPAR